MDIAVERIMSRGSDDRYDSILQKPTGTSIHRNAWLTIELKVKLNFVDVTNPSGRTVTWGSDTFQEDADGWMFPIHRWTPESKDQFATRFQASGQLAWNYRFLLLTPQTCSLFDFVDDTGAWRVRPNVICGFRLIVVNHGPSMSSTRTISGNLDPHQTINVIRLKTNTTTVHRQRIPPGDLGGFSRPVPATMTNRTFRSSATNFDQLDLGTSTVPHELGHLLGQDHIRCLGRNPLPICSTNPSHALTYGTTDDPNDGGNVMGSGTAVTVINAQPWVSRIPQHTYRLGFTATTAVGTLPRSISISEMLRSKKTEF